jgi:hypothetical protein
MREFAHRVNGCVRNYYKSHSSGVVIFISFLM